MKKTFRILTVLLAAVLVSLTTSCALLENLFGELTAPTKKWVSYTDFEYVYGTTDENKDKSIYLDFYLMYSDSTYTNENMKNLTDTNDEVITTLPAGLSVIVVPSVNKAAKNSSEIIKEFFDTASEDGDPFILFTLDRGEKTEIENENASNEEDKVKQFVVNNYSWIILYNCAEFSNLGSKLPAPILKEGDYQMIGDSVNNFSLKKFLGKIAISKLSDLLGVTED